MTISTCYNESAKKSESLKQASVMRKVRKALPEFKIDFKFNPGGIAVWGDTWVRVYEDNQPKVEACLGKDRSYIRQWDGRNSGRNHFINMDVDQIVSMINSLASQPFRRF
jgi:hypothetical protein